jgi:hypothetical protein
MNSTSRRVPGATCVEWALPATPHDLKPLRLPAYQLVAVVLRIAVDADEKLRYFSAPDPSNDVIVAVSH